MASQRTLEHALKFAWYSRAAYLEFDAARVLLREHGYYEPGDGFFNLTEESEDLEAYAHYSVEKRELIVFVRGTEIGGIKDMVRDIGLLPGRWFGYTGHRGMMDGAAEILVRLLPVMAECGGRIYLTGHSLGGGVVTWLQVALSGGVTEVHTFGAPRVFSRNSSKTFSDAMYGLEHFRWVNGSDLVPRLLWWAYRHVPTHCMLHYDGETYTGEAADQKAKGMRWRSIRSFGRRGFKRHRISDYIMSISARISSMDVTIR